MISAPQQQKFRYKKLLQKEAGEVAAELDSVAVSLHPSDPRRRKLEAAVRWLHQMFELF